VPCKIDRNHQIFNVFKFPNPWNIIHNKDISCRMVMLSWSYSKIFLNLGIIVDRLMGHGVWLLRVDSKVTRNMSLSINTHWPLVVGLEKLVYDVTVAIFLPWISSRILFFVYQFRVRTSFVGCFIVTLLRWFNISSIESSNRCCAEICIMLAEYE
jgi:hypothetical protein